MPGGEVKMTDVFLIHPPVSFTTQHLENDIVPDCPPLGLLYLAAGVEKIGLTVKILDAIDGCLTTEDIVKLIDKEKPKVVGITAMTMNIRGAVQLSKVIKENSTEECQVCLGGPHASADPNIIDRFPFFDFCIIGEADITFSRIVKEIICDNKKFKGIQKADIPMNLDEVPLPARHLVDWDYYKKKRGFWANAIMATRGCPFRCIFCSIPAISRKYRTRTPELVVREMEEVYNINGIKTFVFIDDIFTLQRDYVFKLCEEIKNFKIRFRWEAQTRANLVDDRLLKQMSRAGCYKLIFGIESGNEKIRNEIINKRISNKEIQKANELCCDNGIEPDWYLMLGFPTETKRELYDTVNFPLTIKPNPNIIGVHITTPLPGSPLFKHAIEEGIITSDLIDKFIAGELGEGYKDVWPYYVPSKLTIEDLKTSRSQAYRHFYFRPKYIADRIMKDLKSLARLKTDVVQALSLFAYGRSKDDK